MEAKVCCKDGSFRYIEFHFASLGETNLVSFVDLTDRKKAEDELAKVGGRLIDAQESERTRIARDLHDDINQRLALLMIELEKLEDISLQSRTGIRQLKNQLHARASEILAGVTTICHELHPQVLELLSFSAAVQSLCREFGEHHKVRIEFSHKDVPHPLPRPISTCLFRIAQEALRNCIRHSETDQIQVQLFGTPGTIHLKVCDTGVGFEPEMGIHGGGLGLISMRERITLVNGTITVSSERGVGTEIHCSVPFLSSGAGT
jgi:signal transduction histidine kinase